MNRFSKYHVILLTVFLLTATVLAGCSEDEQPVIATPKPIVEPRTRDQAVGRLQTAYETRDVDAYLGNLDPEYLTLLKSDTMKEFPSLGASLNFTEEDRIHHRLFSGEAFTDPGGEFRAAVLQIGFINFRALDTWSETDDVENFPDTFWAPYEVAVIFDRGQNFSALDVEGVVKIYTRAHTKNVGGSEITYYRMAGMVDLTSSGGKGVDSTPWGSVRAYYR